MVSVHTLMLLGNCVVSRLQGWLSAHPAFAERWRLVPAPMIHYVRDAEEQAQLAARAAACDVVLTQPLFSFGPCNTAALRRAARGRVLTLSSPDFPAYFPDVITLEGKTKDAGAETPLEWDSSIILACYLRGMPPAEAAACYAEHPLFSRVRMAAALEEARERYVRREQGVDLGTAEFVLPRWGRLRLFYSPRHPADALLAFMWRQVCAALRLPPDAAVAKRVAQEGFSFNRWPLITRHTPLLHFAEQHFFVVAGREISLEDAITAYYRYYLLHPDVVQRNRLRAVELP